MWSPSRPPSETGDVCLASDRVVGGGSGEGGICRGFRTERVAGLLQGGLIRTGLTTFWSSLLDRWSCGVRCAARPLHLGCQGANGQVSFDLMIRTRVAGLLH